MIAKEKTRSLKKIDILVNSDQDILYFRLTMPQQLIVPDTIVCCKRCKAPSDFFYPFRLVRNEDAQFVDLNYPRASFEPVLFNAIPKDEQHFFVLEYLGHKEFAFEENGTHLLMNLKSDVFFWGKDSNRITGMAICQYCHHEFKCILDQRAYYYKIPVNDRYLYARSKKNFMELRKYFFAYSNKQIPEGWDFHPAVLRKSSEIVKKIDHFFELEKKREKTNWKKKS